MPSYRYTKDIKEEDLKLPEEKQLTGKEKRKNWWHYNLKWVICGAILLVLVFSFIFEMVRKVEPDLTIGLIVDYTMPDMITDVIGQQIAEQIGDVNGDGKTVVSIEVYTIDSLRDSYEDEAAAAQDAGEEEEYTYEYADPYSQMAGVTRLSGAMSTGEVMLFFILDDGIVDYSDYYSIFTYRDGTTPPTDDVQPDEVTWRWEELPGLTSLDIGVEGTDGSIFDAQSLMANFRVGLRSIEGNRLAEKEAVVERWEFAHALLESWAE